MTIANGRMVGCSELTLKNNSTHFPHTPLTRMSKKTTCHGSCPHKNLGESRPHQPCDVCNMFYKDTQTSAYKSFIDRNAYVNNSSKEIRVKPNHNQRFLMMDEGEGVWSGKRRHWEALAEVDDPRKNYSVFKEQVIIKKSKEQNKTKNKKTRSSFYFCFGVTLLGFVLFCNAMCCDLHSF